MTLITASSTEGSACWFYNLALNWLLATVILTFAADVLVWLEDNQIIAICLSKC